MIDLNSRENTLLLNPRLSQATRNVFTEAWRELVEPRFHGQVGVATSGSTGDAQGRLIALSRTALISSARAVNYRLQIGPRDIWFKVLPDFHVGGLGIRVRAALSGSLVVDSGLERWDASRFFDELQDSRATLLSLVPTQVFDLVRLRRRPPHRLRAVIVGGGRLEPGLHEEAVSMGWPLLVSYGLTECCSQVATAISPRDRRMRPLAHVHVRIGPDDHIEIRSAALLTGQIVFAESGVSFREVQRDSWFRTEDCGRIESDGSLTVFGRAGDFVKIGGEGVVMSRLEDRLDRLRVSLALSGDAALVAAPDARLGAAVVLLTNAEPSTASRLVESFNRDVLPFERIRAVYYLSELPRSPLGKLLRAQAIAMAGLPS